MADNYLEKRMEEHLRGAAMAPRHLSPSGQRPGMLTVKFPRRRILVIGSSMALATIAVGTLSSAGCRVSFCDSNRKEGTALAQSTGSRFYPVDTLNALSIEKVVSDITKLHGGLDAVVTAADHAAAAMDSLCTTRLTSVIPVDYSPRLIILGNPGEFNHDIIMETARQHDIIVTTIRPGADTNAVASMLPMLLLEGGRLLHGHTLG